MEGDEIINKLSRLVPSERSHLLVDGLSKCSNYVYESSHHKSRDCQSNHGQNNIESDSSTTATNRSRWYIIIFGQTIALSLSCANAASSILENKYQITIPTFQTGLVYMVLSLHLVYMFSKERIKRNEYRISEWRSGITRIDQIQQQQQQQQQPSVDELDTISSTFHTATIQSNLPIHKFPFTNFTLYTPWYTYFLLAVLDVEANYLALLSLQRTSLSSSILLSSLSVLTTVLLRQLILGSSTYGRKRMFGVFLCLLGGCSWLLDEFHYGSNTARSGMDSIINTPQKYMYAIYGDLLAISAACIFGLNDVLAEYLLKSSNDQTHSRMEYLGMLGLFGAIFSFGVQVPLLERKKLHQIINLSDVDGNEISNTMIGEIVMLLLFVVVMLCYFYMSAMVFISLYDSTVLNLSLQTCPLWAVILTMLLEQSITVQGNGANLSTIPPAMFFISFTMISIGMFLYESRSRNEERGEHVCDKDIGSTDA